jgi:hypothetical protein
MIIGQRKPLKAPDLPAFQIQGRWKLNSRTLIATTRLWRQWKTCFRTGVKNQRHLIPCYANLTRRETGQRKGMKTCGASWSNFLSGVSAPRLKILTDETLDRTGWILLDRPILQLETFLWGVAKKVRQESQKRTERVVAITDLPSHGSFLKDKVDLESEMHASEQTEVRSRCLRLCLNNMNKENRRVFLKYQGLHNKEQLEQLALDLGLTIGALRARINRIKNHLQVSVQQCLASPTSGKVAGQPANHISRPNQFIAKNRKRVA